MPLSIIKILIKILLNFNKGSLLNWKDGLQWQENNRGKTRNATEVLAGRGKVAQSDWKNPKESCLILQNFGSKP